MEVSLEQNFTKIDFELDPMLKSDSTLDQRIDELFYASRETGNTPSGPLLSVVPAAENSEVHLKKPSSTLQRHWKNNEPSRPEPPSPTEFIIASPGASSTSSSGADSGISKALKSTSISNKSSDKSAVKNRPVYKKKISPKLAKWESPDEKIHRYQMRQETAKIKKMEYTAKFIKLKQATRKLDTRKPLPDKATVKILKVNCII